jgi:hypothetical protein
MGIKMATNATWSNMLNDKLTHAPAPKPQGNFDLRHINHVGVNPMYVEKVQKAFKPQPAKVKLNQPGNYGVGSPWQAMGKGK